MKDGKKVVLTYGTFDLFHEGHYNILKRAKEYGDYLIVGVTGESYDKGRGKLSVHDGIAERISNVMNTGLVDQVIIEEYLGQKINDLIRYNVDVFVIGDDWRGKFDHIAKYCELVYLPRTENISSTQIRQKTYTQYRIGIITDIDDENQLAKEAKLVSGYSLAMAYSEDGAVSEKLCEAYEIPQQAETLEQLVSGSDIVFVHTEIEKRADYIKAALDGGKHVICDIPFALEAGRQKELTDLAASKGLMLVSNMKFFSTQIFIQLLWHIQGGLIGDIIKMECSISKNNPSLGQMLYELASMALCPVIKFMGSDYQDISVDEVVEEGSVEFASISIKYPKGKAIVDVGNKIRTENKIEIIGTKGSIYLGDNWWRCSEFEFISVDEPERRKFSMNFTGNGFKFLIKDINDMFKSGNTEYQLFTNTELYDVVKIVEKIRR